MTNLWVRCDLCRFRYGFSRIILQFIGSVSLFTINLSTLSLITNLWNWISCMPLRIETPIQKKHERALLGFPNRTYLYKIRDSSLEWHMSKITRLWRRNRGPLIFDHPAGEQTFFNHISSYSHSWYLSQVLEVIPMEKFQNFYTWQIWKTEIFPPVSCRKSWNVEEFQISLHDRCGKI